jgi:hypothetical protein
MTEPHFAVLRPTGRVAYGHRERGETTNTQGMGRLRTWFSDEFIPDMPANRLADAVIGRLGYRHPAGWVGPVAVAVEEAATGRGSAASCRGTGDDR